MSKKVAAKVKAAPVAEVKASRRKKATPVAVVAPVAEATPAVDPALAALGARWKAGEKITVLAAEAGQPWNTLYATLFKLGYHPTRAPKA